MNRRQFIGNVSALSMTPFLAMPLVAHAQAVGGWAGGAIYVSSLGNDANDGRTWATARRSLNGLKARGATICVADNVLDMGADRAELTECMVKFSEPKRVRPA